MDRINSERVVLVVWSKVLGRQVLFVPDGWQRPEGEERAAFTVSELRRLAAISPPPNELRRLAEVKAIYGGTVEGFEPADGP